MNDKKYILIDEPYTDLKRLVALRDFGDVRKGDRGGLIEGEHNLSHFDIAWVYNNAQVSGNARVRGDARVYDNARVSGNAIMYGGALVLDNAQVRGDARVYGDAQVCGDAWVYDRARVCGDAHVYGDAEVYGDAWVCDRAQIGGDARVYGNAHLASKARVEKAEDVVYIGGWKHPITITPYNIQVGCKSWPDYESFKQTYEQIAKEDDITKKEAKYVNQLIRTVVKRQK